MPCWLNTGFTVSVCVRCVVCLCMGVLSVRVNRDSAEERLIWSFSSAVSTLASAHIRAHLIRPRDCSEAVGLAYESLLRPHHPFTHACAL